MTFRTSASAATILSCLLLAACDSGPSESEMKSALVSLPEMAMLGIEIKEVEKHDCTDAGEGRYRCTYNMTALNKRFNSTGSSDGSTIFERRGDTWVAVSQ